METWGKLHPRRILHVPGAICVHGSFRQQSLEPGTSGQELRILPTGQLRPHCILEFVLQQLFFVVAKRSFSLLDTGGYYAWRNES